MHITVFYTLNICLYSLPIRAPLSLPIPTIHSSSIWHHPVFFALTIYFSSVNISLGCQYTYHPSLLHHHTIVHPSSHLSLSRASDTVSITIFISFISTFAVVLVNVFILLPSGLSLLHTCITNSPVWCFSYSPSTQPLVFLCIFVSPHLHPPSTILLLTPHLHQPLYHNCTFHLSAFVLFCHSNTCHVFSKFPLYSRSTLHSSSTSLSVTKLLSSFMSFLPSFAMVSCFQAPVTHLIFPFVSLGPLCIHSSITIQSFCLLWSFHSLSHLVSPRCTQSISLTNWGGIWSLPYSWLWVGCDGNWCRTGQWKLGMNS